MLLPTRCPLCARAGPSPCPRCAAALRPARAGPYPALLAYEGEGRRLLHALKYRNGRAVATLLGAAMAALVGPNRVDVVTWAPTTAVRRRGRGYDQAEVLARAVARSLVVPCRGLFRRTDRAGPQTGRRRADRLASAPAFAVTRSPPARVLVVDDVVTTGATLAAAGRALRSAGASEVWGLAAGRTPLKPRVRSSDASSDAERP